MSAKETNDSLSATFSDNTLHNKRFMFETSEAFSSWDFICYKWRDLHSTTHTAYIWQLCCDITLQFLEIFHSCTSKCQYGTIHEHSFNLSTVGTDERVSVTK